MSSLPLETAYDIHGAIRIYTDTEHESSIDSEYVTKPINFGPNYEMINPERDFQISLPCVVAGVVTGYLIGAALFIPIAFTILVISIIKGLTVKNYIARCIVLPAQQYDSSLLDGIREKSFNSKSEKVAVRREKVVTCDRRILDGVSVIPTRFASKPKEDQKWMVVMLGRLGAYEYNIEQYKAYAEEMGIGIMAVNWRGVGHSEGITSDAQSMTEDGVAMVQHLLHEEISPKNICIFGHSLGGGIGIQVAKYFQQERKMGVAFVSDRSFADATDVVNHFLDWFPGLREGISLLTRFWWNLNSIDHFRDLEGFKGIIYCKEDGVIPFGRASLYNRVKLGGEKVRYQMRLSVPILKKASYWEKIYSSIFAHCLPIHPEALRLFMTSWLTNVLV